MVKHFLVTWAGSPVEQDCKYEEFDGKFWSMSVLE